MTRPQALVDIVLALALTVLSGLLAIWIGLLLAERLALPLLPVLALQGLFILAGLYALLGMRGQSWRHLALRVISSIDLGRGLLVLALILFLNAALSLGLYQFAPALFEAHQERLTAFAEMLTEGIPFIMVAAVMFFVGFYEELLARGFLLKRCQVLLGGTWGPVLLSSVLFGVGHMYQGWMGVAQTALVGIVFARLTLHWQTLWPAILAHAALNILSLGLLRQLGSIG